jgi:hypothetical protein
VDPDPEPRIHASNWWIRIRILDPDAASFVDLPDASKNIIFNNFFSLLLFEGIFPSFFKDKNSKSITK